MKLKSLKQLLKTAAVTVVTAAMCFGVAGPVLAAEKPDTLFTPETLATEPAGEGTPATLSFIQTLEKDTNVNYEAVTFNYSITANEESPKGAAITNPSSITINNFEPGESVAYGSGTITFPKGTAYLQPGRYHYTITVSETDAYTTIEKDTYNMEVTVTNQNGTPIVSSVTIYENGTAPGDKKGELEFVADYEKTATVADGNALTISKTVTGEYANLDEDIFDFTLQLLGKAKTYEGNTYSVDITLPEGASIYKYENNNKGEALTADEDPGKYTLDYNGTYYFQLKHTQKVVIDGLPIGTTYKVTELDTKVLDNYTPSVVVKEGGSENTLSGTKGNSLASSDTSNTIKDKVADTDGANSVAYTNDRETITPTGLFIDNLPFILLIVIGACGIGAYMVSRRRRYQG